MSVYNVQPDGRVVQVETPTVAEQYLPSLDSTKLVDSRSAALMCAATALVTYLLLGR